MRMLWAIEAKARLDLDTPVPAELAQMAHLHVVRVIFDQQDFDDIVNHEQYLHRA